MLVIEKHLAKHLCNRTFDSAMATNPILLHIANILL